MRHLKGLWRPSLIAQLFAHLLPGPAALGLIPSIPKKISEEKLSTEVSQWHCLEERGQCLKNVDRTHLVLASGKLVLRKKTLFLFSFSKVLMRWEIIRKAGTSEKSFRGCKNRTQDLSVTSSRKTTAHHPGPFQFCTATKMEEPVSSSQDSFHCFFLLRWKTVKTVHSGSGIAPGHLHRRPHLRLLLGFESADEVQLEQPDQGVAVLHDRCRWNRRLFPLRSDSNSCHWIQVNHSVH